jgi:hypothetical protein
MVKTTPKHSCGVKDRDILKEEGEQKSRTKNI